MEKNLIKFCANILTEGGANYSMNTYKGFDETKGFTVLAKHPERFLTKDIQKSVADYVFENAHLLEPVFPNRYLEGILQGTEHFFLTIIDYYDNEEDAENAAIQLKERDYWDCKIKRPKLVRTGILRVNNVDEAIKAVKNKKTKFLVVEYKGDVVELPTPQKAGTEYQKEAYLRQAINKLFEQLF